MDNPQEKVFKILNALNIEYQIINHPAVFTVEDMVKLNITQYGDVCKNLFLSDANGERHFLVVLDKDKKADIKSIQKQLGCTRLSFVSEERLFKYLHLQKGEVTPLGIINDPDAFVEVVLDNDLAGKNKLGFHPNDNTATVWISFDALKKVIEQNGNMIHFVTI
ncbi:prolyl-tRNA synthetase associated domain-containing protein [Desulfosporosinus fructosivorans]|uniref:Prolyl-tRNA synthetase associated domain-containing protein n=1 Tax=Desulfosporosinus fructosivorans TaxID=2018669 RepID=A0A4Z0QW63_9FIRM|nr:prolyl-tRNA synthetase associated domain-containing protein [Desulfosporosinus fructosivorans]TGE34754.1 prolyl-tRNA synthetase associated domain-containing protein [Desulfosporosinus fructosivorans]